MRSIEQSPEEKKERKKEQQRDDMDRCVMEEFWNRDLSSMCLKRSWNLPRRLTVRRGQGEAGLKSSNYLGGGGVGG